MLAMDRVQVSPLLPEFPVRVAVSVTGAPPTEIVAKEPLTFTTMPCATVPGDDELLQAADQSETEMEKNRRRKRFISPFAVEWDEPKTEFVNQNSAEDDRKSM